VPQDVPQGVAGLSNSTAAPFKGLRVLIVHDWLVSWAGAERCVEQMLDIFPDADLVAGLVTTHMREFNAVTRRAQETWLARIPGARAHHRWFVPLEALAFATLDTRGYDLVISSSHSFSKMVRKTRGTRHVCYCYSPPRYLWDLRETYRMDARWLQRLALIVTTRGLRAVDRRSTRGVDRFVAISDVVAGRIRRAYGREAHVVFPPVAQKGSSLPRADQRSDFLLFLGRLVPYKRVDVAIAAAEQVRMRLVVAGDGPDRHRLERLAGSYTTFLGSVGEDDAGRLLSTCRAFVFCGEEDFGIAPLEANAHGTPVVYLRRGGVAETMVPDVTGIPFEAAAPDLVAQALEKALNRSWSEDALRRNAERFSPERFREGLSWVVSQALAEGPFGTTKNDGRRS
jgi:glycosyltransferase involved in cell wall biosynthesis